ncbi:two-component sensor histidine kinase [Thioclava sp. SK-1]|uniref:ATP-binding protein n=1 Tax=Thioclava sp. SK-1 TaxID=1889770 RepID=UPI000825F9F5|nr:ATP-binding protein [Thioclava sp. SK-1]OCX63159.1 two-component sensor histidine kinase [Thioclava sp. SK-1]
MKFTWLKHLMPRGLYGRAALILLVPVVTIQLVVSIVFIQRHFERVTLQMTSTMQREIVLIATTVSGQADAARGLMAARKLADPLQLALELPPKADLLAQTTDLRRFFDLTGLVVIETLRANVPGIRVIDLSDGSYVRLIVDTDNGPLQIGFQRIRVSASNPHQLLVLMVAVGLLMTAVAYLFLRNQLRPIRRLALAADAFGKGRSIPYRVAGASEVRSAGAAFLDMRNRIDRHIEQRTMMLSAISHDLRTPLTRLRLGLSMLPVDQDGQDDVAEMERDVDEMGRLIDAFLDFAHRDATAAPAERTDLAELVRAQVIQGERVGQAVQLGPCPDAGLVVIQLRPDDIRRAVSNLIGNAIRYGSQAEVSVFPAGRTVRIVVEDAGPGIAPERREEAMRPFTRLDPARNQDRGQGVGLGLSICADIARSHGGRLQLGQSPSLGGLKAELILPR